jgi:hypothetical protein
MFGCSELINSPTLVPSYHPNHRRESRLGPGLGGHVADSAAFRRRKAGSVKAAGVNLSGGLGCCSSYGKAASV